MPLASLNYPQLVQMQKDLSSHAPGDPTFNAAAGTLLRALIDDIIGHAKERHEQDQKAAEQAAQEQAQAQQQAGEPNPPAPEPAMAMAETEDQEDDSRSRRRHR